MTEKYHQMKLEEARRAEEQKNAELIRYNVNNGNLSQTIDAPLRTTAAVAKWQYFTANGMVFLALTTIPAGDLVTIGTNCRRVNAADMLNM